MGFISPSIAYKICQPLFACFESMWEAFIVGLEPQTLVNDPNNINSSFLNMISKFDPSAEVGMLW
jgi:hypothetical protein